MVLLKYNSIVIVNNKILHIGNLISSKKKAQKLLSSKMKQLQKVVHIQKKKNSPNKFLFAVFFIVNYVQSHFVFGKPAPNLQVLKILGVAGLCSYKRH